MSVKFSCGYVHVYYSFMRHFVVMYMFVHVFTLYTTCTVLTISKLSLLMLNIKLPMQIEFA